MKKEQIQAKIKSKEDKILILQNEVKGLKGKLIISDTNSNYIYVPEIDKEVEIIVHDKNKSYDELVKIYGKEFLEENMLTKKECELILKNPKISKILKMDGSSTTDDFFIQQFNEENKKQGFVAVFCVYRYWSGFDSDRYSDYAYSFRGVRFVRKKLSEKKK